MVRFKREGDPEPISKEDLFVRTERTSPVQGTISISGSIEGYEERVVGRELVLVDTLVEHL